MTQKKSCAIIVTKKLFCKVLPKIPKKLVLVLATFALMTKSNKKIRLF